MTQLQDSDNTSDTGKGRRWLWALGGSAILYVILLVMSLTSADDFECVTNSWCLEAPGESPLIALFRLLTLVLIGVAIVLTLRVCGWLLSKGWMILVGGMVLLLLGMAGFWAYFFLMDPSERSEFIHILIIGGFGILLGGAMVYSNVAAKLRK